MLSFNLHPYKAPEIRVFSTGPQTALCQSGSINGMDVSGDINGDSLFD